MEVSWEFIYPWMAVVLDRQVDSSAKRNVWVVFVTGLLLMIQSALTDFEASYKTQLHTQCENKPITPISLNQNVLKQDNSRVNARTTACNATYIMQLINNWHFTLLCCHVLKNRVTLDGKASYGELWLVLPFCEQTAGPECYLKTSLNTELLPILLKWSCLYAYSTMGIRG